LGWTVVPQALTFDDGSSVNRAWGRVMSTIFNGASNIAQAGGRAALTPAGLEEIRALTDYYLANARLIKATLDAQGIATTGGDNSPYVWAHFPGRKSWDVFDAILNRHAVVTTPGSGFGPAGEGFVRFSAFGHHADAEEACARLATGVL
jgi:LL-diaminopimelate aminotransferase